VRMGRGTLVGKPFAVYGSASARRKAASCNTVFWIAQKSVHAWRAASSKTLLRRRGRKCYSGLRTRRCAIATGPQWQARVGLARLLTHRQ